MKQYLKFVDGANFACDLCSFRAKWRRSVKRHKQTVHDGIKFFKCDQCEYSSTQSGTLKRHKKLIHRTKSEVLAKPNSLPSISFHEFDANVL